MNDKKRQWTMMQYSEAKDSGIVPCRCGSQRYVASMFRCYYCGEFYCQACAAKHFGGERGKVEVKRLDYQLKMLDENTIVRMSDGSLGIVRDVYSIREMHILKADGTKVFANSLRDNLIDVVEFPDDLAEARLKHLNEQATGVDGQCCI